MLCDKGNMRRGKLRGLSGGPLICEAGGGGGVEVLVDFRKKYNNTCTKLIFS